MRSPPRCRPARSTSATSRRPTSSTRSRTHDNIDTMVGSIPSFSEIALNSGSAYQKAEGAFTPHGDGHPALTDPVVRRAIRMAIDSDQLNKQVLLGYGVPGDTLVPPVSVEGARWAPTGADKISWDIPGANQLLEDAGYVDSDGDGIREMPRDSVDPGPAARLPLLRQQLGADLGGRRPVRLGMAPADRDQDRGHRRELGQAHRHHQRGRLRDVLVGLVPGPRPFVPAGLLHVRPAAAGREHVREQRRVLLQPRVRQAVPGAAARRPTRTPAGTSCTRCRRCSTRTPPTRSCGTTRSSRPGGPTGSRATSRSRSPTAIRSRDGGASARCGSRSNRWPGRPELRLEQNTGVSPVVWAILAGVIVLLVAVFLIRRRRAAEEDV